MELKYSKVPKDMIPSFHNAEIFVEKYFQHKNFCPEKGIIEIAGERYILLRASSMSVQFLEYIKGMYPGLEEDAAIEASSVVLYDMAKSFGISDAKKFHSKNGNSDPIAKLSTGPIHFAFIGWARVDIKDDSNTDSSEDMILVYDHPNAFEADSWLGTGKNTNFCTCFMSAGYSSGWTQESMGGILDAKEILCRAKGDSSCRFIMARPHRLEEFVEDYRHKNKELFVNGNGK